MKVSPMSRRLIATVLLAAPCWLAIASGAFAQQEPEADAIPRLDPVPPPSSAELEDSIRRGVDFLVGYQNPNGSWGSATRTKGLNIYAPIPGAHHAFRAAVTALSIMALIDSQDGRPEVDAAIDRAEAWLIENLALVRRATPDAIYNVWAHGYALQALVMLQDRKPDDAARKQKLRELIDLQIDLLDRYASVDGGWGYYDFDVGSKQPAASSTSFTNAAILVALKEAQQAGIEPPKKMVDKAVAATKRQRLPDFSYLYGEYLQWVPRMGINRPGGSLGRSQACNLALRMWGDAAVTDQVLADWLDRLFARNGWLDIGRKRPVPHEAWMQVAGYFYYFGHYYAARCIEELPLEKRPEFQAHLARTIMPKQETDGSWWDFPFYDYHQPYGTAFAVMTLARCRTP
jgi:hypothetical protein